MDIKQLARQRIAEAEAAIAAAGKSAMNTYQTESFRSDVPNPVPWASAHQGSLSQAKQFPSSFAERLKLHEAHLNALKQASKKPPLPSNPAAQPRTFSSISDPSASYLPPWSQPHHMPTFQRTPQSDSYLTSAKSFEGSRVSTAGSGATIGWAGPWVVTHKQNGPDRMYPANLRPGAVPEAMPSYRPDGGVVEPGALMRVSKDQQTKAASKQSATQPASVEWMLPHRHTHVAPAAQPSAAMASGDAFRHTGRQPAGSARPGQGIPRAPALGSPPGASGRSASGSQIPSPVRKLMQQQAHHKIAYRTPPDGEGRASTAALASRVDVQAGQSNHAPDCRGQQGHTPAPNAPPFPIPATHREDALRRNAEGEEGQRRHGQGGQPFTQPRGSQQALARLANGQRPSHLSQPASDPSDGRNGGREAAAAVPHSAPRQQIARNAARRAPDESGAVARIGSGNSRSTRDLDEEPCIGSQGPHERHAELSAPMARLKRMLRTRSSDSSAAPPTVEERPTGSSVVAGQLGKAKTNAGALSADAPRVLQQSPTKLGAQSSMRKLAARQAVAKGQGSARAQQPRQGAGSTEEQPAAAQRGNIDFEAMVEQKLREEAAATGGTEGRCECRTCGRRFAATVLAKHEVVCAKAAASKRVPMDMSRKRLAGVVSEAGPPARRKGGKARGPGRTGIRSESKQAGPERRAATAAASRGQAWKRKSDAFRAAMRANRDLNEARMRGEDITKLPVFEDEYDDRVPCPHCERKFAPLTAERHIPKCKDIRAKPKFLKRGSGTAAGKAVRKTPR